MDTNTNLKREVAAYLGVAYALALTIAITLPDAGINLLLSVLVPTVSVAIVTFTVFEKGTRKALWRSFGLKRAGLTAWPAAILLPIVLASGAYAIAVATGAGSFHVDPSDATGDWWLNLFIGTVLISVVMLGEEIGWRGYLLPRIQQLTGEKRKAAVLTGFIHGCFHLPLILIATTYDTEAPTWFAAPMAVAVITAGGVFYAWIWDRSQSVWPVAIAHNVVNTVFDLGAAAVTTTTVHSLGYVAGETGMATFGVVAVAAVVLIKRAVVWQGAQAPEISRLGAGAPGTSTAEGELTSPAIGAA